MYRIHIHTEHGNTWTHSFPHTLPSVTTHTFCVLSHTDTCCSNCCPLSDPCRQRSCPLNHCSLGDSHTLAFSCGSRALALQQSTGLLSCLVGKNIHRLILFEWVMLFKKQTVNVLIGNYIHRVNVIKGSLYSQVYGMSCWGEKRYQALPVFLYCKWRKGGSGLGKRQCMSLFPSHSVQCNIMEVKCCTCIVIYYV